MVDEQERAVTAATAARLSELALLFLRLGTTAFGGPAAHIAMMEDEVVRRRGWLSQAQFLDLLGATNMIPGPNSTEMAIHVGFLRAGWPGLLVAGMCFILPAAIMVTLLAAAYVRFGELPQALAVLYGVKPVVIGVIAQALWRLSQTAVKTPALAVVGLAAALLNASGADELLVLFGAAVVVGVAGAIRFDRRTGGLAGLSLYTGAPLGTALSASATLAAPVGLLPVFLFFLKVGSVLFGSGYVLLAFLRADLVQHWGWLTEAQLLDATAVGQVTPGPVFTTATFIGYLLKGPTGALVATLGIFLPAFVFVAASAPLLPRLRRSPRIGAFLDGLNVGSLALMAVVTWQLARAALVDAPSCALGAAATLLLVRFRVNSVWLVLGGAVVGLLVLRS